MLRKNENKQYITKQNKNTQIYVKISKYEKSRIKEKKIHYIKKLIQKRRNASEYYMLNPFTTFINPLQKIS